MYRAGTPGGRRGGQAAIELMAALLLLLLVVGGLLHIAKMVRTSLFLHAALRAEAGRRAMSGALSGEAPEPVKDWEEGPDKTAYTADDRMRKSGGAYSSVISLLTAGSTEGNSDADWAYPAAMTRLPESMARLRGAYGVGGLLRGMRAEETLSVPVEPAIRELAYGKDEVRIREEVWMPLMGGLL